MSVAQPERTQQAHVAAPTGGINTIAAGSNMPISDCIYAYNLTAAEFGLRTRLGWREWCLNLDGEVRSVIPFTGSHADKSTNKLFATTQTGIWDVTSASTAPTQVVIFGIQGPDSGWGISWVMANSSGGHFLLYADEANGYYVYSEVNSTWVKVVQASTTAWLPNTVYGANATVSNGGLTYKTAAGGTSAASGGPTGTGASIVDNTVTWAYTPSINGVDPAKFAFVMVWKNRVWFVEKDTAHAWYLDFGAIFGPATKYQFGNRFQQGGALIGLWSWTKEGGAGMDDFLVAISTGGDLLVYEGIDPNQASAFTLKGVWFMGAIPSGRRIATNFGGDMLVMSSLGILPMSKLTAGDPIINISQYKTYKISNLFNQLYMATGGIRGWALRMHPLDQTLVAIVPQGLEASSIQLAMALTTQGWGYYRGLPIGNCAEAYDGSFYFGMPDGRVCINDGYLDGVQTTLALPAWQGTHAYTVGYRVTNDSGKRYKCVIAGTSAGAGGPTGTGITIVDGGVTWDYEGDTASAIEFSLLTSFQNLGKPTQKQVLLVRPKFLSQSQVSYRAAAKYNWDMVEAGPASSLAAPGGPVWDVSNWDQAVWGGNFVPDQKAVGAWGIGVEVAIAVRGLAASRAVFVGVDVTMEEGGFL
jgi:hypothetical protein